MPDSVPPDSTFPRPGVKVDGSKSNASRVVLTGLDFRSSGLYRCEISVEDSFNTLNRFGRMMVVELPTTPPRITGVRKKYVSGDTLRANCTAGRSHPAATLTWYLNDNKVPRRFTFAYAPVQHDDELETSTLGLRLPLKDHHFSRGVIHLRCTATVAAFYTRSNQDFSQVEGKDPIVLEQRAAHVRVNSTSWLSPGLLSLLLPLLILLRGPGMAR